MKPSLPPIAAFSALLALGITWGSSILISKHVMTGGHHPIGLIFWQLVLGALVLSAYCLYKGRRLPMSSRDVRYYAAVATIGTLIPNSFSYMVAAKLPAGLIAICLATVPMFALLIALLWKNEPLKPGRLLGILLGATAMLLLLGPDASLPQASLTMWVLLALVAPFCYGIEGNYIDRYAPHYLNAIDTLRGASIVGIFLLAPVVMATDTWVPILVPWTSIEWGLLANSLIHVATYTVYIWLVGRTGAVFASQVAYIVTLSGVFLGMLILHESHHMLVWLALTLMLAGLALVQPRKAEQA